VRVVLNLARRLADVLAGARQAKSAALVGRGELGEVPELHERAAAVADRNAQSVVQLALGRGVRAVFREHRVDPPLEDELVGEVLAVVVQGVADEVDVPEFVQLG
jgi:hypothetical protein